MKFKLDENLGTLGKAALEAAGHDVSTIAKQGLSGATDEDVYRTVCDERRVLITLDRDFGEVLRFSPRASAGIAVLAIQGRVSRKTIENRVRVLLLALRSEPIDGLLWIVEPGRVRIHQANSGPGE